VELSGYPLWMYSISVRDLKVEKLNDHFGQYEILLTCQCGHTRRCYPKSFAAFAGWDCDLAAVIKRLRCSKCGARKCTARTYALLPPRGYKSH